jgi:membrane-bound lytic murein transglycosylase B
MLCMPTLANAGSDRVAAATNPQPATTASSAVPSAVPSETAWLNAIAIKPSKIITAAPKGPKAPTAAGLTGPEGAMGNLGIPMMVLRAYHLAADKLAVQQPSCKLPWWLLAGVGHTESGHAEGGRLTADGTTRGLILGPRLNGGIKGDAVISDTDHGLLDGDTIYDRAVGPMQFIPSTWAHWAADGNGDGKKNPSNIFDATLAAARYLCADGRNLSTPAGLDAAVLSYNHSAPYLATVLAWGKAYRDGASSIANSPLPSIKDVTKARPPISARPIPNPVVVARPAPHPSSSAPTSTPPASTSSSSSSVPTPSCTVTATPTPTDTSSAETKSPSATESKSVAAPDATSAAASQSADGGSATATSSTASASPTTSSSTSGCGH